MSAWLFSIPVVSLLCGWLIGYVIIRRLPRQVPPMLQTFGSGAFHNVLAPGNDAFEKLRPLIDRKVDEFLRTRLPAEMPMITMFVGDKTINQLKSIFIKELEQIFPEVMETYSQQLFSDLPARLSQPVTAALNKKLSALPLAGAAAGLLVGLVQLLVVAALT